MGARYADGTPHPREAAKPCDSTPTHLTGNPHSIVLWLRPRLATPFAPSSATYWLRVTPLLHLSVPIGSSSTSLFPGGFLLVQATPSHLSLDSAFCLGPSPAIFHSFCM